MHLENRLSVRVAALSEDVRLSVRAARGMGYRGVQLDLVSANLDLTSLTASGQREVRHIIAREEMTLESIRTDLPTDALMQAKGMDRVIWAVDRAMQATAGLAAGMLCVDVGRLPPAKAAAAPKPTVTPQNAGLIILPESLAASAEPEPDEPSDESAWAPVDEVMREIGALADRYRVVVAFSSELSTYASVQRLLTGAQCPWFGVDLDPVSILRDRWNAEHVLDAVGRMLRHVRGRDAVKGSAGRTQPAAIGRGSTDWAELLAMLDAGGFGGWIAVDTTDLADRTGETRKAVTTLSPR